jgi:hypothetical protein
MLNFVLLLAAAHASEKVDFPTKVPISKILTGLNF